MSILKLNKTEKILLWSAVLAHIIAAFFSNGFYHFDEHFQIFEIANFKLGATSLDQLPWEFEAKMRPMLLPGIVVLLKSIFLDSFFVAGVMRYLAGTVSFLACLLLYVKKRQEFSEKFKIPFLFLSFFLWYLPFLHVRISAEIIGGALFTAAYCLLFGEKRKTQLLAGVLFGLCFWVRFQMGFAILGLFLPIFFYRKISIKSFLLVSVGFLAAVIANMGIDSWFYGEFSFAPWEYLNQNIILGKSKNFGINPFYDYFKWLLNKPGAPLGILIYFALGYRFVKKIKEPITWSLLIFFVSHLFVGHKELRFLFPFIFFIPLFITDFLQGIDKPILSNQKNWKIFAGLNLLVLIYTVFTPAHPVVNYQKFYHSKGEQLRFLNIRGETNPYRLAELGMSFYEKNRPQVNFLKGDARIKGVIFSDCLSFARLHEKQGCELLYSSNLLKTKFMDNNKLKDKTKVWTQYLCH